MVIEGHAGNVVMGSLFLSLKNAESRIEFLQVHAPNDFLSVSKNADSRHHVQYKFALSCIIIKIKISAFIIIALEKVHIFLIVALFSTKNIPIMNILNESMQLTLHPRIREKMQATLHIIMLIRDLLLISQIYVISKKGM